MRNVRVLYVTCGGIDRYVIFLVCGTTVYATRHGANVVKRSSIGSEAHSARRDGEKARRARFRGEFECAKIFEDLLSGAPTRRLSEACDMLKPTVRYRRCSSDARVYDDNVYVLPSPRSFDDSITRGVESRDPK